MTILSSLWTCRMTSTKLRKKKIMLWTSTASVECACIMRAGILEYWDVVRVTPSSSKLASTGAHVAH